MIVSESWIEQQRTRFGDEFCATMLIDSYRDRRGNIFILRENSLDERLVKKLLDEQNRSNAVEVENLINR
jgi:hypothetical protein